MHPRVYIRFAVVGPLCMASATLLTDTMRSIGVVRRTLGLNSYTGGPKQLTMLVSLSPKRGRSGAHQYADILGSYYVVLRVGHAI